jgi:excisionase family DNA binding protein
MNSHIVENDMDDLADDLLRGVEAISAFTGLKKRTIYHLAERGRLPVFKMGARQWCARKSTLKRHIEILETKQSEPAA